MTPQQIIDLELSVIAGCIDHPELVAEVSPVLGVDDLTASMHRALWSAIIELDASGARVDLVAVATRLGAEASEQFGGIKALRDVIDMTPAQIDAVGSARLLAAHAKCRRVADRCAVAARTPHDDPAEWLASLEGDLYRLTETRAEPETATIGETCSTMLPELRVGGVEIIRTGIGGLDDLIGGLRRGTSTIIAARPGIGKTALALSIAINVADAGHGVAFLSLEMPRRQLTIRAMAQLSQISATDIESGNLSQWESAAKAHARERIARMPMAIDEASSLTVAGARRAVRRCVSRMRGRGHSEPLGLIVVDYLQLMSGEQRRGGNREQEVSECSRGLLALAKEFDCSVLALSQLNRSIESRQDSRPTLSDLRESGAIEQDAYSVVMLWRPPIDPGAPRPNPETAEAIVRKIRQGGRCGTAQLVWDGPTMTYTCARESAIRAADDFWP